MAVVDQWRGIAYFAHKWENKICRQMTITLANPILKYNFR